MKYKRDEKLLREMYSSETLAIFKYHLSDNLWLRLVDSYINTLPPTRLYGVKINEDGEAV